MLRVVWEKKVKTQVAKNNLLRGFLLWDRNKSCPQRWREDLTKDHFCYVSYTFFLCEFKPLNDLFFLLISRNTNEYTLLNISSSQYVSGV